MPPNYTCFYPNYTTTFRRGAPPGKVPKLPQQGGITRLIYVFAVEGGGRGEGEGGGDGALYVAAPRDQALDRIGHLLRRRTSPLDRALAPLANALTCARALSPPGDTMGTSGAGCQSCPSVPTCPVDPHLSPASHRRRRHWLVSAFCGQTTNPKSSKKAPR